MKQQEHEHSSFLRAHMMRMLLVDKNEDLISTTQNLFSKMEIEVVPARNEEESLRLMDNLELDVIFMDMDMTGIDSMELLKKLRKRNPVVDIVMFIDPNNSSLAAEAMSSGASDYIIKPASMKDILQKAEESCKRMQKYRYLVESTKADSPSSSNLNS